VRRPHAAHQPAHFLDAENRRQPRLALRPQNVEEMPVALQHVHEEEADPAVADPHRVGRPVVDVAAAQEIPFQFLLGDLIGRLVVELAQHPHRARGGLLRALAPAIERQRVHGLLVPIGHHGSLLGRQRGDSTTRCVAISEESREERARRGRADYITGRGAARTVKQCCREAAYLNSAFDRTEETPAAQPARHLGYDEG